jgi:hypothetical protein
MRLSEILRTEHVCLGRPVDISNDDNERALPKISDNAQKMDRTTEADPANINFVGLEPQLRDNVHRA